MRRKIRCSFELHSSEITGVPSQYQQVKVVVDHQAVSRRYAATYPAPTAATTSDGGTRTTIGLEDLSNHSPLLSWQCGVYPGKAVNLRLMVSTAAPARTSLLARGPQWSHLATATLHLDTLAQQLLLPGVAAAAVPPTVATLVPRSPTASARSSLEPPTTQPASLETAAAAAAAGGAGGELTSPQRRPPRSPVRPTSPFASMQPLLTDENDDAESELFTTDSLAAAATAGHGRPSTDSRATSALGCVSDLPSPADVAAVQDTAEVPPDADEAAGGSYQQDTQTSQLTVAWLPAAGVEGDLQLMQEVVVTARLLEASSPLRLFSRMSPGSASSKRSAASSMLAGKGKGRALFWSKTMNTKDPASVPVHRSATAPPARGHAAAAAAAAAVPKPAAFLSKSQPELAHLDASGRLPSLGQWCADQQPHLADAAAAGPSAARHHLAAATGATSSGSPLSPRSTGMTTSTPFNTPAQLPAGLSRGAAASSSTAAGRIQEGQAIQQQQQQQAQEEADHTVQRDFLELILATLSGAHSLESEAQLPCAPSAAQLAAAASLPRSPSAADLAAFAAATGLPIQTVEAAATKLPRLGSSSAPKAALGRSNSSSTRASSSNSSSVRGSPEKVAPAPPSVNGGSSNTAAGSGSGLKADIGYGLYDVVEEVEGHDVAVPVAAAVAETGAPQRSSTAAAPAAAPAAALDRAAAASQAVDKTAAPAAPAAVVTATALAVSDANVAVEGWEPQKLAVVTTTRTAAPAAAEESTQTEPKVAPQALRVDAAGMSCQTTAAGHIMLFPAAAPVPGVVVTTATDMVVTEPADVAADLTAAAAAVEVPLHGAAATAIEDAAAAERGDAVADIAAGGMADGIIGNTSREGAPAADMAGRPVDASAEALQETGVKDNAQLEAAVCDLAEGTAVGTTAAVLPTPTDATAPNTTATQLAAAIREAMLSDDATSAYAHISTQQAETAVTGQAVASTAGGEAAATGECAADMLTVATAVAAHTAGSSAEAAEEDEMINMTDRKPSSDVPTAEFPSPMAPSKHRIPAETAAAAAAALPDASSSPADCTRLEADSNNSQQSAADSSAEVAAQAAQAGPDCGETAFAPYRPDNMSSGSSGRREQSAAAAAVTDSSAVPVVQGGHAAATGSVALEAACRTEQVVAPVPAQQRLSQETGLLPTSPLQSTSHSANTSAAAACSASLKQLQLQLQQLKQQIHRARSSSSSSFHTTAGSACSITNVHHADDSSTHCTAADDSSTHHTAADDSSTHRTAAAAAIPIVPSALSSGTGASRSSSVGAAAAADVLVGSMGARRELVPGLVEGSSGSFTFAGAGLSSMPAALTTAAADHVSGSTNSLLPQLAPAVPVPHEALGIVAAAPAADFALHDEVGVAALPAGTLLPAPATGTGLTAEAEGAANSNPAGMHMMVDSAISWQSSDHQSQEQQQPRQQQLWLESIPLSRDCEPLPPPAEVAAAAAAEGPAVQHFIFKHPAASAGVLPTAAAAAEITPTDDVEQATNPFSTSWRHSQGGNPGSQQAELQPDQAPLLSCSSSARSRLAQVLQSMSAMPSEQRAARPAALDVERDWHVLRVLPLPHIRPASAASAAASAVTCVGGVLAASSLGALRLVEATVSSPRAALANNRNNRSNTAKGPAAAAPSASVSGGAAPSLLGSPFTAMMWAANTAVTAALFLPRGLLSMVGSMLDTNLAAAAADREAVQGAEQQQQAQKVTQQPAAAAPQLPKLPSKPQSAPATATEHLPAAAAATAQALPAAKPAGVAAAEALAAAAAAAGADVDDTAVMPSHSSSTGGYGVFQLLYLLSWQLPWSVAAAVLAGLVRLLANIGLVPASMVAAWMSPAAAARTTAGVVPQQHAEDEAWEQGSQASSVGSSSSPCHALVHPHPQDVGAACEAHDAVDSAAHLNSGLTSGTGSDSAALVDGRSGGVSRCSWVRGSKNVGDRPLPPAPAPSLETPTSAIGRSWSSMLPASILAALSPAAFSGSSRSRRSSPGCHAAAIPTAAAAPVTAASTASHAADADKRIGSGSCGDTAAAAAIPAAARRIEQRQVLPVVMSGHELATTVAETSAGSSANVPSRLSKATGGAAELYGCDAPGAGVQDQDQADGSVLHTQAATWGWRTAFRVPQLTADMDAAAAHLVATTPAGQQVAGHGSSSRWCWWLPSWGTTSTPASRGDAAAGMQDACSWLLWPSTAWTAGKNNAAAPHPPSQGNAVHQTTPQMVATTFSQGIAPATAAGEDTGTRGVQAPPPAAAPLSRTDATAAAAGVVAGAFVQAWQLASRAVGILFAPVTWYWQGVWYVLSSGVEMTSRLVEVAVWWALLPARMVLWAVMVLLRIEVGLYRWLVPRRQGVVEAWPAQPVQL